MNKKQPTPMDIRYPKREGWGLVGWRGSNLHHLGYITEKARRCVCGCPPVFEMTTGTVETEGAASDFVAICPRCERRAEGHGSLEYCLRMWNEGKMSDDSMMVNMPILSMSETGAMKLSRKLIALNKEEAIELIRCKHSEFGTRRDWKYKVRYAAQLRTIERFFRESPLMMDMDGEAIISDIRKIIYPDLTPEERVKIPLILTEL